MTRRGQFDAARRAIEDLRTYPSGNPREMPVWRMFEFELQTTTRTFDPAVDLVDLVDSMIETYGPTFLSEVVMLAVRAVANELERLPSGSAEPLRERTLSAIPRWLESVSANPEFDLHDACVLAMAGAEEQRLRGSDDAARWASVAEQWRSIGLPYEESYARYRCASAHLSGVGGRSATARLRAGEELRAAHAIVMRLRAEPLSNEIQNLARSAHLDLDLTDAEVQESIEAVTPNPFGLTGREREILQLIALGRTNGEIGDELFISRRTAAVHVSNILRKLGVSNRVEAATVAHRQMTHDDAASRTP
jgi:DNA-binding CsgD family transcriptional regulator